MATSLLSTKLFIPSARANAIDRPHLFERLLSGVDRPGSFALLSGPAGFGKTTLLSNFVAKLAQPVAWVSLDEADNDFSQFWTYLITSCQSALNGVGKTALELLSTPQSFSPDTIPTLLINDFVTHAKSIVLVLDDYHEIRTPSIHASLEFLLDHLPDNLYMMISSRIDPPWPLSRYRARNRLIEIRAENLRFSVDEAAEFLQQTMDLTLSAEDVAALEERTEGWIAGLQLAALSLQGRSDIREFVKAFTGSHIYVAEYLVEEVLQRQPPEIQAFLLQTSILRWLNADLCEAVADCPDGQTILQSLYKENIFVIPLDNEGKWFRYHHLFADLLNARQRQNLIPEAIAALHLRAVDWFEDNGYMLEAVTHAFAARDYERAANLVVQAARALIFAGRVNILEAWLELFPETSFYNHPALTFYQFWIGVLQNKADLSYQAIQDKRNLFDALLSSPENNRLRGELMAVVCRAVALAGRTIEGIRLGEEALAYLPPDDLASRSRVYSALAAAYDLDGRLEEAESAYQKSISQAITAGDYRLAAHTMMVKGLVQYHYGHLHEATRTYQMLINLEDQAGIDPTNKTRAILSRKKRAEKSFLPAGQGYIGLGSISLERNDLETAEKFLTQGMELCRLGGLDGIFIGRLQMSRLRQAKGDLEGALEEIPTLEQSSVRADDFNISIRQIRIALARGNIDDAWHRAEPFVRLLNNGQLPRPPLLFFESIEVIVARVYLARGEMEKTLQVLEKLQATAEPDQRLGRLIEVYLLKALAYYKQNGDQLTEEAIKHIEQALDLGESEGYVTLFLEEGPALIPLLNAVKDHQEAPDRIKNYACKLLEIIGGIGRSSTLREKIKTSGLVEPLTPREMEVLELLAVGDSNQVIADKLVITVRTVKKHTGNIYGKLNAHSRIQAVTRARDLGLLFID